MFRRMNATPIRNLEELGDVLGRVGPLVTLSIGAAFVPCSRQALYQRIERGTLRAWRVHGALHVALWDVVKASPVDNSKLTEPDPGGVVSAP